MSVMIDITYNVGDSVWKTRSKYKCECVRMAECAWLLFAVSVDVKRKRFKFYRVEVTLAIVTSSANNIVTRANTIYFFTKKTIQRLKHYEVSVFLLRKRDIRIGRETQREKKRARERE